MSNRGLGCIIGRCQVSRSGFTLVESVIAMGIAAFLFLAIYVGVQTNYSIVYLCNENQTATQILTEKLETIRLYNWDQINSNGFVPRRFVVNHEPGDTNSRPYYTGTVSIARMPLSENYSNDLRLVTVQLDWVSGARACSKTMSSWVSRHGLHTYVNR